MSYIGLISLVRNHVDQLDPALKRPGRFDVNIAFTNAGPDQARSLFKHFFQGDKQAGSNNIDKFDPLAEAFVDAVFGTVDGLPFEGKAVRQSSGKMSMAALQAYLLRYQDEGQAAVSKARAWSGQYRLVDIA